MRENASYYLFILKKSPLFFVSDFFLNLTAAQLDEFMPFTSHNSVHKVSSHKRGFLTFPF